MSTGSRVPYSLLRFKRFFFSLLRNKKSAFGIILLFIFSFVAIAGPLLTPYTPLGSEVSAYVNPPSWVTSIYGPSGYSQNAEFTAMKALPISGSRVTIASSGSDSIGFNVVVDPSGGTVDVQKSLTWQYPGPAKRFQGGLHITPGSNIAGHSVNATLYLDRYIGGSRDARWQLWTQILSTASEYSPFPPIDAIDNGLNNRLHLIGTGLNAAQVIFSRQADFVYVLEIAIPAGISTVDFSLQGFKLLIYGNTWGILGTDNGGHDIFTQLIYGARLSLIVGLLATFIGVGLGLVVGLIAGYLGKIVDEVLMRFTDMMLVIPGLPLLIVLVQVLGPSLTNIILVLGFLGWMGFARVVRSQVLSLRERPFIEAAKASGAGTGYITIRHILPNVVSLTYVNLALSVPAAIVGEAALSFLGLGDQSTVTWGRMLELSREAGGSASNLFWWWVVPPGLGIALVSLSFILIGFSLDELFNPRLRRRR